MDFDLSEDQKAFVDGAAAIVQRHLETPRHNGVAAAVYQSYGTELEADLQESGFLDLAQVEEFGTLEAALLIEQVTRAPSVVEVSATTLIAPGLTGRQLPRPIAVAREQDMNGPVRFLDVAKTVLVDMGDEAGILALEPGDTVPLESMYAYNYGALAKPFDASRVERLGPGSGAELRRLWQVSIATEAGTAMLEAVERTVTYTKERIQFGKALATNQAIKHRLAVNVQQAECVKWLARKAAWSGSATDAATAALYAQMSIERICTDTHQFHGAIGMTLEFPLHFWTMRLRTLQGELGGRAAQSAALAKLKWAS